MKNTELLVRRVVTIGVLGIFLFAVRNNSAQCSFSSGSTGSDGSLNPPGSVPAGTTTNTFWTNGLSIYHLAAIPLPANGVLNFSNVYIQANWAVGFVRNSANTPVWMLATTDVVVNGAIEIVGGDAAYAMGGAGGPGGYPGGEGNAGTLRYTGGLGPGAAINSSGGFGTPGNLDGGIETNTSPGSAYGTLDLQPLVGGSGASGYADCESGGGGGGGAILIASSSLIDISGEIDANGGTISIGGCTGNFGGSGGGIRLVAPTIQGEGTIHAEGGNTGGDKGAVGRIRIEACNIFRSTLTAPPATFGPPGVTFLTNAPSIQITSIGGQTVPLSPTGSLANADMYLTGGTNSVVFAVTASNVATGTVFTVIITPVYGDYISGNGILTGAGSITTGSATMNVYGERIWRADAFISYIARP